MSYTLGDILNTAQYDLAIREYESTVLEIYDLERKLKRLHERKLRAIDNVVYYRNLLKNINEK